ncbi:RNA editing protein [Perkinsela sp. CCAP 1560/4]|nr:RNA editing protein [Perkinsela sp. CCAP 1560/4]|eukprot:KNH09400.1 RNA editing protein [Perkinsela sp. CCAP 1560/4]
MFRKVNFFLDFRTQGVKDLLTPMLKKKEEFDHVAIDLGELIANALRNKDFKRFSGNDRFDPMYKHIQNNLSNILRRIHARKSIMFCLDGAEGLWKARKYRRRNTRKQDYITQRSAGSPLTVALEDRLQCALLSRPTPTELLFSGMNTQGPVESKVVNWCMDLATRSDASKNDAICLIGGTQMNLVALSLVPFLNLTCIKFDMGDFKIQTLPSMLEWLDLNSVLENNDFETLSKARQDLVWMLILVNGWSVGELSEISGVQCREWIQAYHEECINKKRFLFSEEHVDGKASMRLDRRVFERVLNAVCKGGYTRANYSSGAVSDYFEIALQCHAMLTVGRIPNQHYCHPSQDMEKSNAPAVTPETIRNHLSQLKTPFLSATEDKRTINPAEYYLTISSNAANMSYAVKSYSGHDAILSEKYTDVETYEKHLKISDTNEALGIAGSWLKEIRPRRRVQVELPTHVWVRTQGATGPPLGYTYFGASLGTLAFENETRLKALRGEGFSEVRRVKANTPHLVGFSSEHSWEEFDPKKGMKGSADHPECELLIDKLRVVTYNVQFNRFSGQTTPLGRPGIDWCSDTRYIALSKVISECEADIICMQECEAPWWKYLSKQSWIQKDYYFSCPEKSECITPWGSFMLIHKRLKVKAVNNINLPGFQGHRSVMPAITIQLNKKLLHILGLHLLAPFSSENEDNRKTQVQNLVKCLETKFGGTRTPEDIILLGDFNDYPKNLLKLPTNLLLHDAWQDSGEESAFTIDGDLNEYCALIIEPDFFGRPDRMYYRSELLTPKKWKLIGNKSVRKELETSNCPEYLYPSDHFGVCTEFAVSE